MDSVRLSAVIHGHVQGVGFRWWTQSHAVPLGLAGFAENQSDGTVRIIAEGTTEQVTQLLGYLKSGSTPGSIQRIDEHFGEATGEFARFSTA